MKTIILLTISNIFMTFAWYGHLKFKNQPLLKVILIAWFIAFFEYCFQVPANRIGYGQFSAAQLGRIDTYNATYVSQKTDAMQGRATQLYRKYRKEH